MLGQNTMISTKRLQTVNGKKTYSLDVLENVGAYIEPINPEKDTFMNEFSVYHQFNMFLDGIADLKIGDKVIEEGVEYKVKGVRYMRGGDVPSHTESLIVAVV
jgi:hypothetical protein